jgi:hypothetical protein
MDLNPTALRAVDQAIPDHQNPRTCFWGNGGKDDVVYILPEEAKG